MSSGGARCLRAGVSDLGGGVPAPTSGSPGSSSCGRAAKLTLAMLPLVLPGVVQETQVGPKGTENGGAVDLKHKSRAPQKRKKCESCELKRPCFGLPAEGKYRWCAGCAKAHTGAEDLMNMKRRKA